MFKMLYLSFFQVSLFLGINQLTSVPGNNVVIVAFFYVIKISLGRWGASLDPL